MRNFYPNSVYFPSMRRVRQITDSHCGPATLAMLLSFLGVEVSQEAIAEASSNGSNIRGYGMRVDEMAKAIGTLCPQFQFWFKEYCDIEIIKKIIDEYRYPVGVEWQGIFFDDSDGDDGHYSIVTHLDIGENIITLADPFRRFAGVDRVIHLNEFIDRWWDDNEIFNPQTGRVTTKRDTRMIYIITAKEAAFPKDLGLLRY